VLAGRAFATLSARSAAALLLIAVAGPPGALGDDGRAVVEPVEGEFTGEAGRGEDCRDVVSDWKSSRGVCCGFWRSWAHWRITEKVGGVFGGAVVD